MNTFKRSFFAMLLVGSLFSFHSFAEPNDWSHNDMGRRGAGPGEYCSVNGYYYPSCVRPYSCANPNSNGVGVCAMRCRSDYDCYNGASCYSGTCYQNNNGGGWDPGHNGGNNGGGHHGGRGRPGGRYPR